MVLKCARSFHHPVHMITGEREAGLFPYTLIRKKASLFFLVFLVLVIVPGNYGDPPVKESIFKPQIINNR